ncbi:MAG: SPFH domain-containing protein, partial [Eubacteriaceae bacterium]|nr:SPFH domain-containing protein [Eubacteriaceae bacterium]
MSESVKGSSREVHYEELKAGSVSGMAVLILNILLMIGALGGLILGINLAANGFGPFAGVVLIICSGLYLAIVGPLLFVGLKILKPNEALVLTL